MKIKKGAIEDEKIAILKLKFNIPFLNQTLENFEKERDKRIIEREKERENKKKLGRKIKWYFSRKRKNAEKIKNMQF